MQNGQVAWDPLAVSYRNDLTTKFTVLYLVLSMLVFLVRAIRFLPILRRLRLSAALLRVSRPASSDTDNQQPHPDTSASL
jgi:hypothetical protein